MKSIFNIRQQTKNIESFCQKKFEWKHRKEEEAKKKTSMQQKKLRNTQHMYFVLYGYDEHA